MKIKIYNKILFIILVFLSGSNCVIDTGSDSLNSIIPGPSAFNDSMRNAGYPDSDAIRIISECAAFDSIECVDDETLDRCQRGMEGIKYLGCVKPLQALLKCQKTTGVCFLCG